MIELVFYKAFKLHFIDWEHTERQRDKETEHNWRKRDKDTKDNLIVTKTQKKENLILKWEFGGRGKCQVKE